VPFSTSFVSLIPWVGYGDNKGRSMETVGRKGSLRRFLQGIGGLWREPAVATAAQLERYLSEQAAYIAQKAAIDYCRVKAGLFSYQLFAEEAFQTALAVCRWETFAAVLADILIATEGYLRAHARDAAEAARLAAAFEAMYPAILGAYPHPRHRPQGWGDAIDAFLRRAAEARGARPRSAADVARHSARRLFETLPIHPSMRRPDEEVVFGSVRFLMVSSLQNLERRASAADILRDLSGAPPPVEGAAR
jgi:hypothetical protein